MSRNVIEQLEPRQFFAASTATLTVPEVNTILAQAASQTQTKALSEEVIAVVDREANVLGIFARAGFDPNTARSQEIMTLAIARARTAAEFESDQNAFTTRTARFIIQDHFPYPIDGTPGGPLYGVQFSSLIGNDVTTAQPAISGDPGGVPLYKNGHAVGGVGAAGDNHDVLAREGLNVFPEYNDTANPKRKIFDGTEEKDTDEAIALAGAAGFMAPKRIQSTNILLDGLRLPFTEEDPLHTNKFRRITDLTASGVGSVVGTVISTPAVPYPTATFAGISGELKRPLTTDPAGTPARRHNYGIEGSGLADTAHSLTSRDVKQIFTDAITQAQKTRGGIRIPNGAAARVHVTVVDRAGNILGVFAEDGATNFSYDVAVQKARTANFFSDNTHAFSTRAIGFMSQGDFPVGIDGDDVGPLFHVQNELSANGAGHPLTLRTANSADNPLRDGITVFPGGVPLYKNGVIVGAIGVSGDGVDQDDLIAYNGSKRYLPNADYRSDRLAKRDIRSFITSRAIALFNLFGEKTSDSKYRELNSDPTIDPVTIEDVVDRLQDLNFRLPYVDFPRNPDL